MDAAVPERRLVDEIEAAFLSVMTAFAVVLNILLLMQILTSSKQPTVRTSFSTGPYQLNSFTLFKLNLCISDFVILLCYSLGKIIWLITYKWQLGDFGCRLYQFLSTFGFYAHSNIIVAIGLDRLKVVYIRHLQGATSVRRVRLMLIGSWTLAGLCSVPQAIFWESRRIKDDWHQCVNSLVYRLERNSSDGSVRFWVYAYETFHQATVFWIPFFLIFVSYIMIVVKLLLHHTFRSKEVIKARCTDSDHRTDHSSTQDPILTPVPMNKKKWTAFSSVSTSSESYPDYKKNSQQTSGLQRCRSIPTWRRQLRSRVFRSALAVVFAHVMLWLPYNCMGTLRLLDIKTYDTIGTFGANFLEDMIVVNSLLNPLLYGNFASFIKQKLFCDICC